MGALVALALVFALAAPIAAPERIALVVEYGRYRMAPATIRLRVIVEPNDANRHLVVVVDGPNFYRSSYEALTGASPRTRWFDYRDLPGGDYGVGAAVTDAHGEHFVAHDGLTVVGY